jgi:hypothetical protein
MSWDRWGKRLLLGGLAIVTGAFARNVYDVKVRELGRTFRAGELTARGGDFACIACGARFRLAGGAPVPACPSCRHLDSMKTG